MENKKNSDQNLVQPVLKFDFKPYLQTPFMLENLARILSQKSVMDKVVLLKPEGNKGVILKSKMAKPADIIVCTHLDRKHYARGMCLNCYLKSRQKATGCTHPDRPKYAKNMCCSCYARLMFIYMMVWTL